MNTNYLKLEEFLIGKKYFDGLYYCYIYEHYLNPYDNCVYMKETINSPHPEKDWGCKLYPTIQTIIQLIKIYKDVSYNNQLYNNLLEFYPEYII